MNAFSWAEEATEKLKCAFEDRLSFVGLQGSRARGEETASSDIDLVVLIEDLESDDLATYKEIIQSMPHSELACGFIGSPEVLRSWPRHELFQFVNDTVAIYGTLPFAATDFTREDAREAAIIGASGIYHATCHAAVFDGDMEPSILRELAKAAIFTLQALEFARTGNYVRKRAGLASVLHGEDEEVLGWAIKVKEDPELSAQDARTLSNLLLRWSEKVLAS